MTTVNTIGNFQAAGNAPGVVPLGAIIAMTSGLTGAMAIPASGVVSNGYMRADGTAIPASNAVSGTTPNLSTSIFLRGATTFGGTGGGTAALTAINLPTLTSTGTSGNGSSHTHGASGLNYPGSSISGTALSAGDHNHPIDARTNTAGGYYVSNTGNDFNAYTQYTNNAGAHTHTLSGTAASVGITGNTAAESAHTHSLSVTSTGTNGATGQAFNVIPNYIDVVYLIRVN